MDCKVIKRELDTLQQAIEISGVPAVWQKRVKYYLAVVYFNFTCSQLAVITRCKNCFIEKNMILLGIRLKKNAAFAGFMKKVIFNYSEIVKSKILAS